MAMIECKCPNCGGMMKVDNNVEKAICPYCGTTSVIGMPVTVNNGNYIRQQVNHNKYEQHFEPKLKATVDLSTVALYVLAIVIVIICAVMDYIG